MSEPPDYPADKLSSAEEEDRNTGIVVAYDVNESVAMIRADSTGLAKSQK